MKHLGLGIFLFAIMLTFGTSAAWAQQDTEAVTPALSSVEVELRYVKEQLRNLEDRFRFQTEKIRMLERKVEENRKRLERRKRYIP